MGLSLGDIDPVAGMYTGKGVFGGLKDTSAEDAAKRGYANAAKERDQQNAILRGQAPTTATMKKGGTVRSSASKRADGIAQRGKTRA